MTKIQARIQARRYSDRYNTFWYVREVSPGVFQPYAHHSDDDCTVATFYCGKELKPEPKFEIEQTKMPTFWLQRKDGKYDGLHFMDDFGNHVELDFGKLAITVADGDFQ